MCLAGNIGVKINIPKNNIDLHAYLFGEDQSRYLIEINDKNKGEVNEILEKNSIYYELIGKTQKEILDLGKYFTIKIKDLLELNSFWFKNYFEKNN